MGADGVIFAGDLCAGLAQWGILKLPLNGGGGDRLRLGKKGAALPVSVAVPLESSLVDRRLQPREDVTSNRFGFHFIYSSSRRCLHLEHDVTRRVPPRVQIHAFEKRAGRALSAPEDEKARAAAAFFFLWRMELIVVNLF